MCSWMAYKKLMHDVQEKKELIGKDEIVGLVRGPGREVSKSTEG